MSLPLRTCNEVGESTDDLSYGTGVKFIGVHYFRNVRGTKWTIAEKVNKIIKIVNLGMYELGINQCLFLGFNFFFQMYQLLDLAL